MVDKPGDYEAQRMADPTAPKVAITDHKTIWLEPVCVGDGRCWSEDGAHNECECGGDHKPTKYIRADLAVSRSRDSAIRAEAMEEEAKIADRFRDLKWADKGESEHSKGYGIGYNVAGDNIGRAIRSLAQPKPECSADEDTGCEDDKLSGTAEQWRDGLRALQCTGYYARGLNFPCTNCGRSKEAHGNG